MACQANKSWHGNKFRERAMCAEESLCVAQHTPGALCDGDSGLSHLPKHRPTITRVPCRACWVPDTLLSQAAREVISTLFHRWGN